MLDRWHMTLTAKKQRDLPLEFKVLKARFKFSDQPFVQCDIESSRMAPQTSNMKTKPIILSTKACIGKRMSVHDVFEMES